MTSENKKANHMMVDIETLGTNSNAVILSAAFVPFRIHPDCPDTASILRLDDYLYLELDVTGQLNAGRGIDADTVKWWMNTNVAEFGRLVVAGATSPAAAVSRISEYCEQNSPYKFWAKGVDFDKSLLESLFRDESRTPPWKYYQWQDARTVIRAVADAINSDTLNFCIAPENLSFGGTKHNALCDAQVQAVQTAKILHWVHHSGKTPRERRLEAAANELLWSGPSV